MTCDLTTWVSERIVYINHRLEKISFTVYSVLISYVMNKFLVKLLVFPPDMTVRLTGG